MARFRGRSLGGSSNKNQPEELTETDAPNLSAPKFKSRFDLSGGVTNQMRYDEGQATGKTPSYSGGGLRVSGGKVRSGWQQRWKDRETMDWAKETDTKDRERYKETKPRRAAMSYVLKLPRIRSRGFSNRGMRAGGGTLG